MNKRCFVYLLFITPVFLSASFLIPENAQAAPAPKTCATPPAVPAASGVFYPFDVKCSKNVWLDGEVLLWQSNEDGLGYALESKSQTTVQDGHFKSPDFDWDWGFRLGLGFKFPNHDRWDLFFNYTYVHAHAHGSAHAPTGGAVFPSLVAPASGFVNQAKLHWNANLNILDVELGRSCFAGKWLTIRPFMGVRGALIDQTLNVNYSGGTAFGGDTDQLHATNDFWGIGLRMGLNTLWGLGRGWGIYGNGAASILSGHFDVKEKEKLKTAGRDRLGLKANNDTVVVVAGLALGLQWDHFFSRDRYHFGFKLGWEFNLFFDQNRFMRMVTPSNFGSIVRNDGDLSFQGLTAGFRFDF